MGGTGTDAPLVQAGSSGSISEIGSTSYYLWYELLGTSYSPTTENKITSISCSPGDDVYSNVYISVSGSTTTVHFYLANFSENTSTSFTKNITTLDAGFLGAEWICEAPFNTKTTTVLNYPKTTDIYLNTDTVTFQDATYDDGVNMANAPNLIKKSQVNGSTCLSQPTDVGTGSRPSLFVFWGEVNSSFDVNWKNYK